jgi:para-aminobenzoate synthetase
MHGKAQMVSVLQVESFTSVHQLVSTVRGRKRECCSGVDAFFAAFPGGSMTGAPKIRSMELIDCMEGAPRGVYSGGVGFFSLDGSFDFNIVIRTATFHDGYVHIGAGGAIVVQSDREDEYKEMQLKAQRLLHAFSEYCRVPRINVVEDVTNL